MSNILEYAKKYQDFNVRMRREFHQHPELSGEEFRTSQRVAEELDTLGIPYQHFANTGLVATIDGPKEGKMVFLRADMDALSLQEQSDVPYKSQNNGVMHACGHDGHTSSLLTAAKILMDIRPQLKGTVKLLFQPDEELAQKGAKLMLAEGALDGADGVMGLHFWPDIPCGKVSVRSGAIMADSAYFKITVRGRSGHGAKPDQTVDATLAASAILMNLQSIVSREIYPIQPAVVSVGTFHSGSAFHIISDEAVLEGTVRFFDSEVGKLMPQQLERIITHTATAYRAESEFYYRKTLLPLVNDEHMTEIARASATSLFGADNVVQADPTTGCEDFALYAQKAPLFYAFIGSAFLDGRETYPGHHCMYDLDEDALANAAALYAQFAVDFLAQ